MSSPRMPPWLFLYNWYRNLTPSLWCSRSLQLMDAGTCKTISFMKFNPDKKNWFWSNNTNLGIEQKKSNFYPTILTYIDELFPKTATKEGQTFVILSLRDFKPAVLMPLKHKINPQRMLKSIFFRLFCTYQKTFFRLFCTHQNQTRTQANPY